MIITTSWDDGHPCDDRLANLLNQYNLAATFYIPRVSQLATLPESAVRDLSARFEIGAHTLDHLALTTLSNESAVTQIKDSKRWVEEITGSRCTMFCPPLGMFSRTHADIIAHAGYEAFRTVEMGSVRWPGPSIACLEIATTIQAQPHANAAYLKNALKRYRIGAALRALRNWTQPTWVERAAWYLEHAIKSDGVFHLWGHSWEIEEYDQWKNVEAIFRKMADAIENRNAVPMTNGQFCQLTRTRREEITSCQ